MLVTIGLAFEIGTSPYVYNFEEFGETYYETIISTSPYFIVQGAVDLIHISVYTLSYRALRIGGHNQARNGI